jgi:hypothetical protein
MIFHTRTQEEAERIVCEARERMGQPEPNGKYLAGGEATMRHDKWKGRGAKPPKPSWRDSTILARDLCDKQFPTLKYIVPGLFSEGVILLVSRPKLGKSWLLQQIGSSVALGNSVLVSPINPEQPAHGDVLYLNLEDGERRAQRRMTKYFGAQRDQWPERMTIARVWRRLNEGGLTDLREWCGSVEKPTLIMIDTLKRVRPPKRNGQSDYDADYEACQGLLDLCRELPGLVIIVAHHDRKLDADDVYDTVSGTLGLTGGVDTIAILKRSGQGVTLHIQGRDLVDDVEKAVSFDRETCRWQVLGEASEVHRSDERKRVLGALNGLMDGLSVNEIKASAGLGSRDAADKILQRMAANGEVFRLSRGKYGLYKSPLSETSESPKEARYPQNMAENTTSDTSDSGAKESATLSETRSENAPALLGLLQPRQELEAE